MNPRQRRGVLFMLLAVVIGIGVFFSVTSYVSSVESQVGSKTTVFEAAKSIDPYTPLSAANLTPVEVPQRWTSPDSRLELREVEGRRLAFRLEPGTVISSDMFLPQSALSPTQREVAINVNPVTGVGGRIAPGDFVDVYAVFGDVAGLPKEVQVLVRNVRVVSIGGKQTVQNNTSNNGIQSSDVVPVTLAVEPKEALAITYAANFAAEVRLVGLPTAVGPGANRAGEPNSFTAKDLGGKAVAENGTGGAQ